MPLLHFSAGTHWPHRPLVVRDACAALWARLRARFPAVFACVLMPDHLHLLVKFASAEALMKLMASELSGFTRSLKRGPGPLWKAVEDPRTIPNLKHLRRQIRYVHLNPCRDKLASDPLEWEWSTHREYIGASALSWVDRKGVDEVFDYPSRLFGERFHHYVSSDPSVRVGGTLIPERVPPREIVASLSSVEWAVLQATRARSDSRHHPTPERRLMLLAAQRLGATGREHLSEWVGIRPRAIQDVLRAPVSAREEVELKAVFLLLSDRRRFGG